MGKRDLTRLVNLGLDADEIENLTEEQPRPREREKPEKPSKIKGFRRTPRPWKETQ